MAVWKRCEHVTRQRHLKKEKIKGLPCSAGYEEGGGKWERRCEALGSFIKANVGVKHSLIVSLFKHISYLFIFAPFSPLSSITVLSDIASWQGAIYTVCLSLFNMSECPGGRCSLLLDMHAVILTWYNRCETSSISKRKWKEQEKWMNTVNSFNDSQLWCFKCKLTRLFRLTSSGLTSHLAAVMCRFTQGPFKQTSQKNTASQFGVCLLKHCFINTS